MKRVNYFLGVIALLVAGCSGKGEYTRKLESKLELMERHLSEGKQAKAKEVEEDIGRILKDAYKDFVGIMNDIDKVLSDVDRKCPKYRQVKSEISNMQEFDFKHSSFGVASLDEIRDMKWGERAEQEWKMTKKYLLWVVGVLDKMIVRAEEIKKKAKEARKDCDKR